MMNYPSMLRTTGLQNFNVYFVVFSAYSSSKLDASQLDSKSESNADTKLAESIKTISAKSATPDKNSAAANE